jgi:hypothetical protein
MKNLLSTYLSAENLKDDYGTNIVACAKRVDGKLQWSSEGLASDCAGKLVFSSSDIRDLIASVKVKDNIFQNAQVPLNSTFLTSLSATALLYIAAFFVLLSRQLTQKLIGGIASVEGHFLRSPFAWVGFMTGVFLFTLSCIF